MSTALSSWASDLQNLLQLTLQVYSCHLQQSDNVGAIFRKVFGQFSRTRFFHDISWFDCHPQRFLDSCKIPPTFPRFPNKWSPCKWSSITVPKYQPTRNLRSSAANLLHQPVATTTFSSQSFSIAALTLWNKPSVNIRLTSAFANFKSRLKTELFTLAYHTQDKSAPTQHFWLVTDIATMMLYQFL